MKKRNFLKVPWILTICLFVLSALSLNAQINCEFPCTGAPWQNVTANIVINKGSNPSIALHGIAYFKKRFCNGKWEFMLDSAEMKDNSKYLDSLLIYEHNYSAFRDLIDMQIMEHYIGIATMPNCPSDSTITKIYSAACGVWLKCRYEITPGSRMCDDGFAQPYPDYTLNGKQYVDIWKWHPCGEVCCQKIYTVCKAASVTTSNTVVKVKQIQKQRHPNTPNCSLQNQFRDGITNQIIPCQDGC